MMTSAKFSVSWCYREVDQSVRRTLFHSTSAPCIEAARLISGNPYAFDVEVLTVDDGSKVLWQTDSIGRVLAA